MKNSGKEKRKKKGPDALNLRITFPIAGSTKVKLRYLKIAKEKSTALLL